MDEGRGGTADLRRRTRDLVKDSNRCFLGAAHRLVDAARADENRHRRQLLIAELAREVEAVIVTRGGALSPYCRMNCGAGALPLPMVSDATPAGMFTVTCPLARGYKLNV